MSGGDRECACPSQHSQAVGGRTQMDVPFYGEYDNRRAWATAPSELGWGVCVLLDISNPDVATNPQSDQLSDHPDNPGFVPACPEGKPRRSPPLFSKT